MWLILGKKQGHWWHLSNLCECSRIRIIDSRKLPPRLREIAGSIHGRCISMTLKMVVMAALLGAQDFLPRKHRDILQNCWRRRKTPNDQSDSRIWSECLTKLYLGLSFNISHVWLKTPYARRLNFRNNLMDTLETFSKQLWDLVRLFSLMVSTLSVNMRHTSS